MKHERRLHVLAAGITAAIVASMVVAVVVVNRAALWLSWDGAGGALAVTLATLIAIAALIAIIYRFVLEILQAFVDRQTGGAPVPALMAGLTIATSLILYTIIAPPLYRLGQALGVRALYEGWGEPESQIVRVGIVFALVMVLWYLFDWRYRPGSLARTVREWWWLRRGRRGAARRKGGIDD